MGTKVADGTKVTNQLTLKWGYSGGPNDVLQRAFKVEEAGRQGQSVAIGKESNLPLLPLKREEGTISQGMPSASRSWRDQGNAFTQRP
ncbi:hypothetical protein H671_2g8249 [Cricetulus griseus]|nr:hypothetical protein H671_2g8249 [Cricetulus griseus]